MDWEDRPPLRSTEVSLATLIGWLLWWLLKLLVVIGVKPVIARRLVNTSASPIINDQLARLTQCQEIGLALCARYAPGVSGRVMEFDMTADAALRSIDDIVLTLDRARRELVKSQRPLEEPQLQELLAYGRQLQELAKALS